MTKETADHTNPGLDRDEEAFAAAASERLRDSAGELDAATRSRLNQARQQALDEMSPRQRVSFRWLPASATVAVTALAAVWFGTWTGDPDTATSLAPMTADEVADFELLLESDDLEMIEDLEFFAWLATTELETAG